MNDRFFSIFFLIAETHLRRVNFSAQEAEETIPSWALATPGSQLSLSDHSGPCSGEGWWLLSFFYLLFSKKFLIYFPFQPASSIHPSARVLSADATSLMCFLLKLLLPWRKPHLSIESLDCNCSSQLLTPSGSLALVPGQFPTLSSHGFRSHFCSVKDYL